MVGAVVWSIAWRVGFGEGRLTVPLRLIYALAEHEVACRGRDPDQVARGGVGEGEDATEVARHLMRVCPGSHRVERTEPASKSSPAASTRRDSCRLGETPQGPVLTSDSP